MKQSTGTYTSVSVTAPQSGQKAVSPSQYCSFYKAVSHKVSHALHTYSGRHSDFSVPQHIGVDQWNGYVRIIKRDGNCKLFLLHCQCIFLNNNNIRLLTSSLLPRIWDKRALNVTVPSSVRQTSISPRGRQLNCDKVGSSVSITINTDAIRQVKIDVMSSSFPNRETAA